MKRKFYITVSAFSLAALVGTAGASDFENLSVFATFVATLVWTALFVGFGTLAIKTPAKKRDPPQALQCTGRTQIKMFQLYFILKKEDCQ